MWNVVAVPMRLSSVVHWLRLGKGKGKGKGTFGVFLNIGVYRFPFARSYIAVHPCAHCLDTPAPQPVLCTAIVQ